MQHNFVQTYRDVITPDLSKQLIAMFEESEHQHEEIQLEGHRSFTQVTLQNHTEWKPFAEMLSERFFKYIERYMQDCEISSKMFPEHFAFEQFRMKRYLPNEVDEFCDHVDVGDIDSAKRFLVFFLYLDDNEGGATDFPQFNISVKPEIGKMLMFPPMWTHLHAGRKATEKPKYIIGSYLHYV